LQTFLPYPNFDDSARTLDRQRLGKQRVETLQIAKVVAGVSSGWRNHPAVRMWLGHPEALLAYQRSVCEFWTSFKFKDTCLDKTAEILGLPVLGQSDLDPGLLPGWLGDSDLHLSHRSNLVRKFPEWYGHFWPEIPDDLPYVWPS
jgi:hypothetical protein